MSNKNLLWTILIVLILLNWRSIKNTVLSFTG